MSTAQEMRCAVPASREGADPAPAWFRIGDLPATPWKNGGGLTREIVCRPAGAGIEDFEWRASVAEIAVDGPFSPFPGVDRVITLLDGAGVRLCSADGRIDHRLDERFVPFAFAGEEAVAATLLGGACSDFNVMTRRAVARAEVRVARTACELAPTGDGVLCSVDGAWRAKPVVDGAAGPARVLGRGEGAWWGGSPCGWLIAPAAPGAVLLVVRIEPVAGERRAGGEGGG